MASRVLSPRTQISSCKCLSKWSYSSLHLARADICGTVWFISLVSGTSMSREWVPKNLSGLMKLSQSNEVFTFLSFFFFLCQSLTGCFFALVCGKCVLSKYEQSLSTLVIMPKHCINASNAGLNWILARLSNMGLILTYLHSAYDSKDHFLSNLSSTRVYL